MLSLPHIFYKMFNLQRSVQTYCHCAYIIRKRDEVILIINNTKKQTNLNCTAHQLYSNTLWVHNNLVTNNNSNNNKNGKNT